MKQRKRLHPHLKAFIHSVVQAEVARVGETKRHTLWAEKLFHDVEDGVLSRIEEVKDQADLKRVTREEVARFKDEFSSLMDLVGRTLEQLPLDLLKQAD